MDYWYPLIRKDAAPGDYRKLKKLIIFQNHA
jgi:hypothetical protein